VGYLSQRRYAAYKWRNSKGTFPQQQTKQVEEKQDSNKSWKKEKGFGFGLGESA